MQVSPQETAQVNPFGEQFRTFQFYPSESHKKVVHRITRGLECNCGLILLTGEIGIGKTSVCRHIMQSFGDKYIFAESGNPFFKPSEQLYNFCKQYEIDTTSRNSISDLTEGLYDFFMQQAEIGRKPVIIIDESHLLGEEHFSLLLALYNMRLGAIPLVQIILIGQVEIMDRLKQPGLEALNQRIGVRCELFPMNMEETENYVQFKLVNANFSDLAIFEKKALTRIWNVTGGLPRLINHISSHALDTITFSGTSKISSALIDKVASDPMYQGLFTIRTKKQQHKYGMFITLTLVSALLGWSAYQLNVPALLKPYVKQALFQKEIAQREINVRPETNSRTVAPSSAPLLPKIKTNILAILPPLPEAPELTEPDSKITKNTAFERQLTIPTKNSAVSVTVYDASEEETFSETAKETEIQQENNAIISQALKSIQVEATSKDSSMQSSNEILDEPTHPALEALQIDALAWSKDPSTRMVVIGNQVLHEGDLVGNFVLKTIGRDHLIFSLNGTDFKKNGRS